MSAPEPAARPRLLRLLPALLVAVALGACGPRTDPMLSFSGPTMGTGYSVKIARPPAGLDPAAVQAGIDAVLAAVNAEISTYDPASELSRLNQNPATDWLPVSGALLRVLREGIDISAATDGAFDITIGPLVNLWGFGPDGPRETVPDAAAIDAARARVGYGQLTLQADPPALRKARGDVYIDLSALGEGVGADRVADWLESIGVTDYLVAVAGTMRVRGHNARGEPWGIAIERPIPGERAVQRVLPLAAGAVSTSGDYRNFFEAGGRRYSHHIDPRTGASVAHQLASVTVVLPDPGQGGAMRADGWATALIVQGEARAPLLAESLGLAAYFIIREDQGFREVMTPAFATLAGEGG